MSVPPIDIDVLRAESAEYRKSVDTAIALGSRIKRWNTNIRSEIRVLLDIQEAHEKMLTIINNLSIPAKKRIELCENVLTDVSRRKIKAIHCLNFNGSMATGLYLDTLKAYISEITPAAP